MDPYLEAPWPSVHKQFVALATLDLNDRLPTDLSASPQERVEVRGDDEISSYFLGVMLREGVDSTEGRTFAEVDEGRGTAIRVVTHVEPALERQLQIVENGTGKLITIIEFLSPSNKRGQGLRDYLEKRADFLRAGVSVLEVDLVRAGSWQALLRPHQLASDRGGLYRVKTRSIFDLHAVWFQTLLL